MMFDPYEPSNFERAVVKAFHYRTIANSGLSKERLVRLTARDTGADEDEVRDILESHSVDFRDS